MNELQKLRKRIGELMTENEVIKANAIKVMATGLGREETATSMYSNARRENQAYQTVLEELDKIESEVENG